MAGLVQMPDRGIATQFFEPQRFDAGAPERGGRVGGVTLGWPLWRAVWTLSRNITPDMSDEWRSWFLKRRGLQRPFLAIDRERLFPKAYRTGFSGLTIAGGSTPFTGNLSSWSQTIDSEGDATITLNGLPAGFVFTRGDYVGLKWDATGSPVSTFDRRAMCRAIEPVTANSSGQAVVEIEPPLNTTVVPAYAVAHLDNPACRMRLITDQSDLAPMDRRLKVAGGTITAIEDLRP